MGDAMRYIIPAPADDTFVPVTEVPVELTRTPTVQGRLFEKHILTKGTLIHPKTGKKIAIDDAFVEALQRNFANGVCPIVQVPLANDKNEHVENPGANIGEVVGISERGGKVYSLIDARDEGAAAKLGKTYLGASGMLHMDYTDTRTNEKVGPTLLHVAVTNRPYVTDLDDYSEVLAASDDSQGEVVELAELAAPDPEEPEVPKTREELLAELKEQHGVDVEALTAALTAAQAAPPAVPGTGPDAAALSQAIVDALKTEGVVSLAANDGNNLTQSDLVSAVVELAQTTKAQAADITHLRHKEAEHEVDGYIAAGRVLPKQRAAFVQLAMTDRDMLDNLLPVEPVVKLNAQEGQDGPDGEQRQHQDIKADVARLTAEHSQFFTANGQKK